MAIAIAWVIFSAFVVVSFSTLKSNDKIEKEIKFKIKLENGYIRITQSKYTIIPLIFICKIQCKWINLVLYSFLSIFYEKKNTISFIYHILYL